MSADKRHGVLQGLLPLSGVVFPLLTSFASSAEPWIKIAAASFASVVLLVWVVVTVLLPVIGQIRRRRHARLSASQAARLRALLTDLNVLSYSFTRSPFCSWHELSNDTKQPRRMDYRYHGAIHTWLLDLREITNQRGRTPAVLARSLSLAVLECGRLAERASEEVHTYLSQHTMDADREARFRQQWGIGRETFNNWTRDCSKLFLEINASKAVGCLTDFPAVPPLGV